MEALAVQIEVVDTISLQSFYICRFPFWHIDDSVQAHVTESTSVCSKVKCPSEQWSLSRCLGFVCSDTMLTFAFQFANRHKATWKARQLRMLGQVEDDF